MNIENNKQRKQKSQKKSKQNTHWDGTHLTGKQPAEKPCD